jgi:hypothetical protein
MKPGACHDSKWTWLQMTQGLKHEAVKLQEPKQKMQELVQKVPLYKPRRKWRQGSTCRRVLIINYMRSSHAKNGAKSGQKGPGPTGPCQLAWPIFCPVQLPLWPSTPWAIKSLDRMSHGEIHSSSAATRSRTRSRFDREGSTHGLHLLQRILHHDQCYNV